ncbi:MAG: diguanylate cyclase [Acidimicrobiales bacterium]
MGSCTRVVRTSQTVLLTALLVLLKALQAVLSAVLRVLGELQRKAEGQRSAAQLLAERARLTRDTWRAAFEAAPLGIAKVSLSGRLQEVNPAFCALVGQERLFLLGRRFSTLVHPDDLGALAGFERPGRPARPVARAEVRLVASGGRLRWCEVSSVLVSGQSGQPHVLVHVVDITRYKRSQAQLRDLATRDPLTGLANRRWFELQLARHVRACLKDGPKGAVLVIDLDNFKNVNDTLGHQAGDQLVAQAAATFLRHLRDHDLLARVGGDEFAVLLRDGGAWSAESVARKLVIAARDEMLVAGRGGPRGHGVTGLNVTVSVGVAPFEVLSGESPQRALRAADVAMYSVKRSGRNGYAVYGAPGGPHHARPSRPGASDRRATGPHGRQVRDLLDLSAVPGDSSS